MIPSRPIRGLACTRAGASTTCDSALAIDVLVAVVEGVDAVGLQRRDGAERAGEVDDARGVLAHHRGLDRVARPLAESEDAVAAHQDGARAVRGERVDDPAADLLVAD